MQTVGSAGAWAKVNFDSLFYHMHTHCLNNRRCGAGVTATINQGSLLYLPISTCEWTRIGSSYTQVSGSWPCVSLAAHGNSSRTRCCRWKSRSGMCLFFPQWRWIDSKLLSDNQRLIHQHFYLNLFLISCSQCRCQHRPPRTDVAYTVDTICPSVSPRWLNTVIWDPE